MNLLRTLALSSAIMSLSLAGSFASDTLEEKKLVIRTVTQNDIDYSKLVTTGQAWKKDDIANAIDRWKSIYEAIYRWDPELKMQRSSRNPLIYFLANLDEMNTKESNSELKTLGVTMGQLAEDLYLSYDSKKHINPKKYIPFIFEGMKKDPILCHLKNFFLDIQEPLGKTSPVLTEPSQPSKTRTITLNSSSGNLTEAGLSNFGLDQTQFKRFTEEQYKGAEAAWRNILDLLRKWVL